MSLKTTSKDMFDPEKTTIFAKKLTETGVAYYLDCEGDKVWLPKSKVSFDEKLGKVTIPDWLFKEKFPNG